MINLASIFNFLAKHLECDEHKDRFEKKLGKIVRTRPATMKENRRGRKRD